MPWHAILWGLAAACVVGIGMGLMCIFLEGWNHDE